MATVTKHGARTLAEVLDSAPRVRALLERAGNVYLGACVIEAEGRWTRVGPTWLVKDVGYVIIGAGVSNWGTTLGLAELSTATTAKPSLHAFGVAIVSRANIVFAMTAKALSAEWAGDVRELAEQAQQLMVES